MRQLKSVQAKKTADGSLEVKKPRKQLDEAQMKEAIITTEKKFKDLIKFADISFS